MTSATPIPSNEATSNFSRQNQPCPQHHFLIHRLRHSKPSSAAASFHSFAIKSAFVNDTFTANHLINLYVALRKVDSASKLFDEMPHPNVVSFTSLISGHVAASLPNTALRIFRKMMTSSSVSPNEFTFATVISACSALADIATGRRIHALVEVSGVSENLVVGSALVDMYGKCNEVVGARRVFDLMGGSCGGNVVSWTSMIAAYAQNGGGEEALRLFKEFNRERSPNHFMLASVVNACASLGRLVSGKAAHGAVIRHGHWLNEVIASAVVDMYAKCGCVDYSVKVFRRIQNLSVIPYTSMIVAAAKYGLGKMSIQLFNEMIGRGIRPNDVTFVGILHACSHSGLVDEGLQYYESMRNNHGITPNAKHLTCVVDMLGRTGRLHEAHEIAKTVKAEPSQEALVWGTVLSTSRLHGRVDIAVQASKRLIDLNQQVAGAYVTLSNAYASCGEWETADGLRSEMKRRGVKKEPGCSWVEIKDSNYVFYAGDVSSCARQSEVISLLRELEVKMKQRGYVGSKGLVFVDVEEEAEEVVGLHSERLALGFALLSIPKGVTIRIMKNLRMCSDCHEAFKLISDIVAREFVVRDVNRFHHFKAGKCTCRDFW